MSSGKVRRIPALLCIAMMVSSPALAAPCPNFDHSAMKPWEPFGDARFPVIS